MKKSVVTSKGCTLRIDDGGNLVEETHFNDEREFFVLGVSSEGSPFTAGNMSIKNVRKAFRQYTDEWAAKQDVETLETLVSSMHLTPEWGKLINVLEPEDVTTLKRIYESGIAEFPKTEIRLLSASLEFVFGIVTRFLKENLKPKSLWEFNPISNNGTFILEWLFRRQA